ncbi:MAG: glutamate 5-kinase [Chloroflexota bacterium]
MTYRRYVVKLGTTLLTSGTDQLDREVMAPLVEQVARLRQVGREVIVVSSGAIAAGREKLNVAERRNAPFKQVLASVGQSRLMNTYEALFGEHDITIAQALLTKSDLCQRSGYLNARNTLLALLELGIVCIVNENDVVALDEIEEFKFGDNDNLSAMVANLVDADLLVLLTDTGGLYTADPHVDPHAELVRRVQRIDDEVGKLAGRTASQQGVGGMVTKIEAARLATSSGVHVLIAGGREPQVLERIDRGEEIGTLFPAVSSKMESRKRWLLSGLGRRGCVFVDRGAAVAVRGHNRSLLPAGVVHVKGRFQRGDVVDILEDSTPIAYGICNYDSTDVAAIRGARSDRIAGILGHHYGEEVVHRNNMVIL